MKNIAIIPARSGSKGLPDKNIKLLCGTPLLAYTIRAALQSGLFHTVFVSTDSERYAELARHCDAQVPFLRSAASSSDTATSWQAVREALVEFERRGERFDTFMLLQPTSPLRDAADIRAAYRLLEQKQANAIVGVCETEHSPLWCNTLDETGSMERFLDNGVFRRSRQQLQPYYRINGALYLANVPYFLEDDNFYRSACYAYVMPRERSVDIDTELDFAFAGLLMQQKKNAEVPELDQG